MLTAGNHTPDKEVTMAATRATQHVPTFNSTIFAHRGLPSRAPENTLAAFDLAADEGATWIETDVDIIADGTPIIITTPPWTAPPTTGASSTTSRPPKSWPHRRRIVVCT